MDSMKEVVAAQDSCKEMASSCQDLADSCKKMADSCKELAAYLLSSWERFKVQQAAATSSPYTTTTTPLFTTSGRSSSSPLSRPRRAPSVAEQQVLLPLSSASHGRRGRAPTMAPSAARRRRPAPAPPPAAACLLLRSSALPRQPALRPAYARHLFDVMPARGLTRPTSSPTHTGSHWLISSGRRPPWPPPQLVFFYLPEYNPCLEKVLALWNLGEQAKGMAYSELLNTNRELEIRLGSICPCLSLFLQPKPPWLFILTQPDTHVEEKCTDFRVRGSTDFRVRQVFDNTLLSERNAFSSSQYASPTHGDPRILNVVPGTCFFGLHQGSIQPEPLMSPLIQWDPGILTPTVQVQLRLAPLVKEQESAHVLMELIIQSHYANTREIIVMARYRDSTALIHHWFSSWLQLNATFFAIRNWAPGILATVQINVHALGFPNSSWLSYDQLLQELVFFINNITHFQRVIHILIVILHATGSA